MSKLQVFNTLTGKKEDFVPLEGNKVKMYACGPTVYDLSHLGHARMTIVWDVVQRYLRFSGYDVTYVRNITDVDDKIIARAAQKGISPDSLARQYTYAFWHDMNVLNVQSPDYEPRATEYIKQMIAFTEDLIVAEHAYEASGDVYFDVASFKDYGKLGKQDLEKLISGSREQAVAQETLAKLKRSPADFALWKSAEEGELGWFSPWGRGRPGWHLECSAMVKHLLGETIDIHAGGEDLVFPHHENEIAQSEALHKKPMAKYWLHNSFVQVSAEKMSKSLGNFSTIQDLLTTYSPDTIRLFILQSHYRNPIDFTLESLNATRSGVQRLLRAAYLVSESNAESSLASKEAKDLAERFQGDFREAMNNDFNTAIAISHLFQLSDQIFTTKNEADQKFLAETLCTIARVLGLTLADTRKHVESELGGKLIELLLTLRQDARAKKDFQAADQIRKTLTELGINVMDTAGGASWERL